MAEWLEKEVYSVEESDVKELQSCKCPRCGRILTTPYIYYFDEFPYCPNCGKKIKDKPAVKVTPLTAVKTVIDRAGIPQSKVAEITGLATQTVSNYYVGRTYPNLANFALICKACGVTVTIKDRRVHINAVN